MHLALNSAKLKIFNLPKHYPVVKVGPHGLADLPIGPSDPLVGELQLTDQRSDGVQTPNDGSIFAEPPFSTAIASRAWWGVWPRYSVHCRCVGGYVGSSGLTPSGGDEETRTPDPLLAKEMLCQLSYVPGPRMVVGVSGLEPETSALSGQCSNQLS